jgi:hypothetical protein
MYGHISFQEKIRRSLRGKHKKAKIGTDDKIVGISNFIYQGNLESMKKMILVHI